ncbi:MAG TPA: hypothetical protein VK590_12370 [Saprospiraceae bacterium]|nr:hypothetical protein [Saprospiraceae bacterium]
MKEHPFQIILDTRTKCPGYCIWCETDYYAESPRKPKRNDYMVYPVHQWLIHKEYTEKTSEEMQYVYFSFVEEQFMNKLVSEYEMLRFRFFNSHPYQQSMIFEVLDDLGRIYKNKKLRAYLDEFDENTQRDVYELWCKIEDYLYRIFY